MNHDLEEQIFELQHKIQFQEDALHKLDAVVIEQSDLIQRLTLRLKQLEEKVKELSASPGGEGVIADERPPHY